MNPDLVKERNNRTFDPIELTYVLDGGKDVTEKRRRIEQLVWNDNEIQSGPNYSFMGQTEMYNEGIRKATLSIRRTKELGLKGDDKYWYQTRMFPNENTPAGLHTTMFIPALENLADDDLKAEWLPKAYNYEIMGTYAQTEMGHGTFLRGLETTATYDARTEEFILHTPTLTATKWWPGGLGKTSNFAVVMATLLINGKKYGMQGFLVQLRSLDTHQPMPGITIGDIGPKLGNHMNDNGFLRFDHVRVPRKNMFSRNAEVHKDGTFIQKGKNEKLNYGVMVMVRAHIVSGMAGKCLAQACTIATRYCCVRRQSEMKPGGPEPQVLDYQTVQQRVFPWLASAYAFLFAGADLAHMYVTVNKDIQEDNMEMLPELHSLSSGLKAYSTEVAAAGIEELRMACGGHGYSLASGFTKIYVHAVSGCTFEGENNVLYLQTARYLTKCFNAAQRGVNLSSSVAYLSGKYSTKCAIGVDLGLNAIVEAFKHRAIGLVTQAVNKYNMMIVQGKPQYIAWNMSSVTLSYAAKAHLELQVVDLFVKKVTHGHEFTPDTRAIVSTLCRYYALNLISKYSGDFLKDGYMNREQLEMLEEKKLELLKPIRRDAIALTDAFDFHDNYLQSVLGRYDGNVYENLYKWAKSSPLNKTEVHESYHKYIRPLQREMSQSKL